MGGFMISKEFIIKNKIGLHARPAATFVQTVSKYRSRITISKDNKEVNAKSIVEVLSLGVEGGTKVVIKVDGSDEKQAMEAIEQLIENNFKEQK